VESFNTMYEGKRILVTGGAGCIGGNLCAELSKLNVDKVIILDDLSSSYEWNMPRAKNIKFVRGSILEDLDLGKGFLSAGVPVRCRGGRGAIRFRMYPGGIAEQVEGWSKNMARGAQGAAPVVLACLVLWITGTASAAFFAVRWCVTGPTFAALQALVFYFLYAGQFLWMLRRAGNFGPLTALVFPGHLLFAVQNPGGAADIHERRAAFDALHDPGNDFAFLVA